MRDFGVELETEQFSVRVFKGVKRAIRLRGNAKAWRRRGYLITVAHPYIHLIRQAFKEWTRLIEDLQSCITEFPATGRLDLSTKLGCKKLQTITDSQHRAIEILQ